VQAFHDRLAADFRSRSGKKTNLFLDWEGLNTGDVLSDRLKKALNASAILIPILSPTYLSSRYGSRRGAGCGDCGEGSGGDSGRGIERLLSGFQLLLHL
jgi:hypothetical protein